MKRNHYLFLGIQLLIGLVAVAQTCIQTISTFPYEQHFDSLTTCLSVSCNLNNIGWNNSSNDDLDFLLRNMATPNTYSGPNGDYSLGKKGKYIYVEGYNNRLKKSELYTPCFVLDSSRTLYLEFAYHMVGKDQGSLTLEILDKGHWTQLFSNVGETKIKNWHTEVIELSPFLGDTVQFRFIAKTGNGNSSDIAIDAFQIKYDHCNDGKLDWLLTSNNKMEVTLSWSSLYNLPAQIEYGPKDFIPGTGQVIVDSNHCNLKFPQFEVYDVYLRKPCDSNSYGIPLGPFTIDLISDTGDWAAVPYVISSLPFVHQGNTSKLRNLNSLRFSKDACYRYVVEDCIDKIDISLCNGTFFDSYLYVLDSKLKWIRSNDDECGYQSEITNLKVNPGDTIYILVEGYDPLDIGQFQLEVNNASFKFQTKKNVLCKSDSTLIEFNAISLKDSVISTEWYRDGMPYFVGNVDSMFMKTPGEYSMKFALSNGTICKTDTIKIESFQTIEPRTDSICIGDSINMQVLIKGQNYQWYRNGVLLPNDTLDQLSAILGGNYNVFVSTANSCSDSSSKGSTVELFHYPQAQIELFGDSSICEDDSVRLLSLGQPNHHWYMNDDTSYISTNQSIQVSQSGSYFVVSNIAGICFDTSDRVQIDVLSLPEVKLDSYEDLCTYSDPVVLTGGFPIGGVYSGPLDSNNVFDPQLSDTGSFQFIYTYIDSNLCSASDTSVIRVRLCTGIKEDEGKDIFIFPQPTSSELHIVLEEVNTSPVEVIIYNSNLQQVHQSQHLESTIDLNLSGLNRGVYVLVIQQGDERIAKQIILN